MKYHTPESNFITCQNIIDGENSTKSFTFIMNENQCKIFCTTSYNERRSVIQTRSFWCWIKYDCIGFSIRNLWITSHTAPIISFEYYNNTRVSPWLYPLWFAPNILSKMSSLWCSVTLPYSQVLIFVRPIILITYVSLIDEKYNCEGFFTLVLLFL